MTTAALKIFDTGTYAEVIHSKVPFSRLESGVVVIQSQIAKDKPLNEHLVWLWGMVKNERRALKSAIDAGAKITCECEIPKGPVRVLPNASEMLHLLGAELLLVVK